MTTITGPRSRSRSRARSSPRRPREIPTAPLSLWPRDPGPRLASRRWLLLVGLLLVAALALAYLWVSWQWVYTLNELHKARAELQALQAERDRLLFEIGRAFSLERIEKIARERLGMYRPEPQYLQLDLEPFAP